MVGYVTKSPAAINKALIEFLPELDSEYAAYPMNHPRWYQPNETGPKGEPCFVPGVAAAANNGTPTGTAAAVIRKDYAYCSRGPNGAGYYSLLCHVSYMNLHEKLKSVTPQSAACPCFNSKETRDALDRYDDCKRVIFMRQRCTVRPDDKLADDIVMGQAKATAQAVYNATQNEQLVVNAVQTGINASL